MITNDRFSVFYFGNIKLYLLCLIGVILPYNLFSQNVEEITRGNIYDIEVIKIDSTKDYYVIYAISETKKFKIASRKIDSACRNIFINERYTTRLTSMDEYLPKAAIVLQSCDIHYDWGEGNEIKNEAGWGCTIFISNEIYGLCYTTDIEEISKYEQWKKKNPIKSRLRAN